MIADRTVRIMLAGSHIYFQVGPATAFLDPHDDDRAQVWSVLVKEADRGRGHGRRLMGEMVRYADARGWGLSLYVSADNDPAIKLYESVGFAIVGTHHPYGMVCRVPVHTMVRPVVNATDSSRTEEGG